MARPAPMSAIRWSSKLTSYAPMRPKTSKANTGTPLLLVLPGSRKNEIKRLIEPFGRAVERLAKDHLAAGHRHSDHPASAGHRHAGNRPLVPSPAKSSSNARIAGPHFAGREPRLAKSGTVTLELGISGIPMITAYKVSGR